VNFGGGKFEVIGSLQGVESSWGQWGVASLELRRGQKWQKSVVSDRFANSITTAQQTCCQQVRNKLAASPFTVKLWYHWCSGFWA